MAWWSGLVVIGDGADGTVIVIILIDADGVGSDGW